MLIGLDLLCVVVGGVCDWKVVDEFVAFGTEIGFKERHHGCSIDLKGHSFSRSSVWVLDGATVLVSKSP